MDIFDILTLCGGIGMFLFGMNLMGSSLKNLAGGSLEKILEKLTTGKNEASGNIKGYALGTGVTAIIQSSAATTIMLIGFVNAGIMKLSQAVPVVFGANLGSCMTAQILRLGDLAETNIFLRLLKPSSFAPILICVGAFIILFTAKQKKRDVAGILVGLGILFLGMNTMEGVFTPLKDDPNFQRLFVSFTNPIIGILIGLALTAIIQSSSASVGILQAMSPTGVVTYANAIPIIIGMNIGKCFTILLGAIGANKKAKRVSLSYLFFNLFGAVVFVVVIYGAKLFIDMPFMATVMDRGDIANAHSLFNLVTGLLLLPFSKQMVKITGKVIGDDGESKIDKELATLDDRLLSTPTIAVSTARNVMFSMADAIRENFDHARHLLHEYSDEEARLLEENEDFIDKCESALNNFLLKVTSQNNLSRDERLDVSELLNSLSDMERIGDHCEKLQKVAKRNVDEKVSFSEQGLREIDLALEATDSLLDMTLSSFRNDDLQTISRIEPLAQTIGEVTELIRDHHVSRLQTGECGIEGGFALVDILTSLERMSSHCKNIGLHIAKKLRGIHMDEMHGHIDMNGYKTSEEYKALTIYYSNTYVAPIASEVVTEKPEKAEKSDKKAAVADKKDSAKDAKEKPSQKREKGKDKDTGKDKKASKKKDK